MKKAFVAIALATSVFALSACTDSSSEEKAKDDVVVSTKYGEVTKDEFYNELKAAYGKSTIVNLVVTDILKSKYDVEKEEVDKRFNALKKQLGDSYQSYLDMQGLTEKQFKDNIEYQILLEKAAKDLVSKEEIEEYYNKAKYELNARHILVDDEKSANELYNRLQKGEDFAKLAKEYSKDPGTSKNGGELGWFTVGDMVDEFTDAAYSLNTNEISKPIKTQFGYHIIQVTGKREIKDFGSLEDKENQIRQVLLEKKIIEILKDSNLEVKDKDLKDAFNDYLGEANKEGKEQKSDQNNK
ncbi:peptidylprolyl isomerase [Ureibacillus sp. FSL K6-8385]|uniref:Foldase protein PrsA n=1 Tax=Ureibacillus terrenus TaxID=118246 RepID=A0A540V200_9BACL|nr:peptidylprolyl isomerase [Ureibacillus terrenus]MED3661067.1 peptidylprolyl isomerase [Ureibacillus terrenus]MED3763355.1 peptidylprolyl isomerase [Ureibacillus terrenus]TQE90769.1 foldase [Ureibacillus terrenus]